VSGQVAKRFENLLMHARAFRGCHHNSHIQLGIPKGTHRLVVVEFLPLGEQVKQHGCASVDLSLAEFGRT